MAVRLFLISGAERLVTNADEARLDGAFFLVVQSGRTVLTLLADNVVRAQVENAQGEVIDHVAGTGSTRANAQK